MKNAAFSYKHAMSKANVKAIKMRITKWTYYKALGFAKLQITFLKNLV